MTNSMTLPLRFVKDLFRDEASLYEVPHKPNRRWVYTSPKGNIVVADLLINSEGTEIFKFVINPDD